MTSKHKCREVLPVCVHRRINFLQASWPAMYGWTKDCGWSISSNINPPHSLFVCGLCNICRRDKITRFGFRLDTDNIDNINNTEQKNNNKTTTTCSQFTLTGADDDDGQVEDRVETIRRHVDVKTNNLKSSSFSSRCYFSARNDAQSGP